MAKRRTTSRAYAGSASPSFANRMFVCVAGGQVSKYGLSNSIHSIFSRGGCVSPLIALAEFHAARTVEFLSFSGPVFGTETFSIRTRNS